MDAHALMRYSVTQFVAGSTGRPFPRRCPPLFLAPRFSPVAVPQRWTGGAVSNTPDRFLSRRQVEARCGIGRSMIYKLLKDGGFPAPFKISRSAVRWSEREIAAWLASRPRAPSTSRINP